MDQKQLLHENPVLTEEEKEEVTIAVPIYEGIINIIDCISEHRKPNMPTRCTMVEEKETFFLPEVNNAPITCQPPNINDPPKRRKNRLTSAVHKPTHYTSAYYQNNSKHY